VTTKTTRLFFICIGIYVAVLICRVVLVKWPPAGLFYNIDELEMTLSCLDRFLGVPSTSLQWPGSILQMLMLPVITLDFFIHGVASGGVGGMVGSFSAYIAHAYANPIHSVVLLRMLVAAIASTAPVLAFLIARVLNESLRAALLCSAIVAFAPVFARQSAMAMGEGVAVAFVFAAVLVVLRYRTRGATVAGVLFAAALSARITTGALIALPVLLILFADIEPRWTRVRAVARFLVATALGFLFWCPYLWTEPIRFAKALLGHVRPQAAVNLTLFTKASVEGLGPSLFVLTCASVIACLTIAIRSRQKGPAIAAVLATLCVALPLLSSGNDLFPRYFLPLLPCVVTMTAVALRRDIFPRSIHLALVTLFSLGCVAMFVESAYAEAGLRKTDELAIGIDAARALPGIALYLPQEALYLYRIPIPEAVYKRMYDRATAQLQDHSGLLRFLRLRGISDNAAKVLMTNFTEDEQALDARLAAAASASVSASAPLYFYFDPASIHGIVAERLTPSDYTTAEALEHFRASGNSAILLRERMPGFGSPVWKGAHEWFLYRD
jgi:hypothetical protein